MRSRKRTCSNPPPKRFGDHCFGDSIEDELCNSGSCAGIACLYYSLRIVKITITIVYACSEITRLIS